MVGKSRQQEVAGRMTSSIREKRVFMLSSLSPFHALKGPSPGNGNTHSGQAFPTLFNQVKIVPYRHNEREACLSGDSVSNQGG